MLNLCFDHSFDLSIKVNFGFILHNQNLYFNFNNLILILLNNVLIACSVRLLLVRTFYTIKAL